MKIAFRPYQRRDGALMLYINRSNGVSIGISADHGFSPYARGSTQGMRHAMAAAMAVFRAYAVRFTGDLNAHHETGLCAVTPLADGWTLVGTDAGSIGGMPVGQDGHYVIRDGWMLRCGTYAEPDKNGWPSVT